MRPLVRVQYRPPALLHPEPLRDPVNPTDQVALEHENWIAYLTGVVRCTSEAQVNRDGGVVTILTGLPFDWFNQVLIEHEEATPAAVLAGVVAARGEGNPFAVRL